MKKVIIFSITISLLFPSIAPIMAQESLVASPPPIVDSPVADLVATSVAPTPDATTPAIDTTITDPNLIATSPADSTPTTDISAVPNTSLDANSNKVKDTKDTTTSAMAASSSSSGSSAGQVSPTSISHITVDVDQASGALNYNYNLTLPAGRNAMTPTVNISYNSEDKNNATVLGLGWALSIPKIERVNKRGTDILYSNQDFRSSLSGELKYISGNQYGAKVDDGSFLNYQLASGAWTVTAKDGTVYTFGDVASAKLSNPNDASKIYTWYVTKVQDTNGNFITYNYFKDVVNNAVYPDNITYTNNGGNTGPYFVRFLRENRPDQYVSYAPGFLNEVTKRISEITIFTSGSWIKYYTLSYVLGDNGSRSILTSITETGRDELGNTTTLPALNLSYTPLNNNFVNNSSFNLPALSPPVDFSNPYIRIMDVNGDGLKDIVRSEYNGGPIFWVLKNNGSGWYIDNQWTQPEYTYTDSNGSTIHDKFVFDDKVVIGDWNGDGKDDLVKFWPVAGSTIQNSIVLINTGNGWQQDTTVTANSATYNGNPVHVSSGHGSSYFGDLNGDGLLDYVYANSYQVNGISYPTFAVWYNQNGNLVWDNSVAVPWTNSSVGNNPLNLSSGVKVLDINNDGLTDFIMGSVGVNNFWVLLNTGHGWVQDAIILQPAYSSGSQSGYLNTTIPGWVVMDVNGDRLPDWVRLWNDGTKAVLINNGHGWTQNDSSITVGMYSYSGGTGYPDSTSATTMFFDATGDGLDDVVNSGYSGGPIQWLMENVGFQANLLMKTTNPQGANYIFGYKSTSNYKDNNGNFLNPNFPATYNTLQSMAVNDGNGQVTTTNYEYADGSFYYKNAYDRQVAGFGKVTVTDPAGNKTKSYFHLGNGLQTGETGIDPTDGSLIGKMYRQDLYNNSIVLSSQSYTDWTPFDLGSNRDFAYASRVVTDENGKQVAKEYSYNTANGNLTQEINYGKVSASGNSFTDTDQDKYTTNYTYTTSGPIKIATVEVDDQSGTKASENKFYYDNQALGVATLGNQTKVESWISGSTYINNQKTYNSYGLVATETDPRGKVTQYAYDAYNLYPVTITNALSQATQFAYDYGSGQVKQKTDPNTRVFQYVYDGLGRLTTELKPDATNYSLQTTNSYLYTDTPNAVSVKKSNYLDAANIIDSYTYFDGLGRKIQEKTEAEGGNFSTKDYAYNNLGQLSKESLLYFSNSSSKTSPITDATLYINYSYDALGRVTTLTNTLGTTANAYNAWKLTTTDANGKYKDLYKDAYDNLVQVDEHNASNIYSTYYTYNYLGNILKITDALGNIRNFTYNGLGQRLTAQDLHAPADTTFGAYTYTYDNAGNVIQVVNPNNQTMNYTYDDINRQLTEDYTGSAGVEVTNTYDAGVDGKGHLTSVVSPSLNQTNTYNALGLLKTESKTINAVAYLTTYDYDRQGNQILITNPDNSQVKNIYNSAGFLNQVQRKESTDSAFTNVVTNFDYSPEGKIVTEANANGITTTNTYDPAKLYRLTNKVTIAPGGAHLQDLTYTYDAVGNITRIVDASSGVTAKTANYVYDDLYRLSSATITNVASGQQTYTQSFTYDPIGNILTKTETIGTNPAVTSTYTYAGNVGTNYANPDAVTSISAGTNTTNYTYDNNGNMTTDGVKTYTFDYNNRLTQASIPGIPILPPPTTTTFYPSVGDGSIYYSGSNSWSTTHNAVSGTSTSYTGTTFNISSGNSGKGSKTSYLIERAFIPFNTSALPDNATINDVKLKVYVDSKMDNDNDGSDWTSVVQASEPSTTALTTADYDLAGSVTNPLEGIDASERKDITNVVPGQYMVFTLNSTGKGWISKTGLTKLGLREGHDAINSAFVGTGGQYDQLKIRSSEYSGTTADPILEITYTTPAAPPPPTIITYAYDLSGQRIKVSSPTVTTYYPTKNYNTDGTTSTKHLFAGSEDLATIQGTGAIAKIYYNSTDFLNSSSIMTDNTGAVVETLDYYPYGTIRVDNKIAAFTEQRKFIGQEYDAETGLNYLNARYYNPTLARFVSQDPMARDNPEKLLADPQNLNEYSYARNNPIILIDTNGQTPQQAGLFLAGVGTSFAVGIGITAAIAAAPAITPFVVTAGIIGLAYEGSNAIKSGISSYQAGGMQGLGNDTKNYIDNNPFTVGSVVGAGACMGLCGTVGEAVADVASEMGLSSRLSNNALVVRGGGLANQTTEAINRAIQKSITDGNDGISVQSSNRVTNISQLQELSKWLKNSEVAVTKVRDVRSAGSNVIRTPGIGEHATVVDLNPQQLSPILRSIYKNSNPRK